MLMGAKNQTKLILLSVKYNIMRAMTNRVTFLTNVIFMILNNATFIIQWVILFQLKENIGGYHMKEVLILWGLAASTFGISHIFFLGAYQLPDLIMNGKLDSFLVQPKNVLLGVISSGSSISAIGDVLYGYLIVIIFHFDIKILLLFTYFTITGAIILTAMAVIGGSLSFYIVRGDIISGNINNTILHLSTYPDGIFKGVVRILMFTIVPVGLVNYLPIHIMFDWDIKLFLVTTGFMLFVCIFAFFLFYRGLKRYSSSNLMSART
jgi:ABC-2 type transport system permease protein